MVHDESITTLSIEQLYLILQLRADVFVIEQQSLYRDIDGRDLEPETRHLWIGDGDRLDAVARVTENGGHRRIGKIVTAPAARGRGHAGTLIRHALATTVGPWHLDGQAHLADWYRSFGFEPSGPAYDDAGILHVPMIRLR